MFDSKMKSKLEQNRQLVKVISLSYIFSLSLKEQLKYQMKDNFRRKKERNSFIKKETRN